jgi:hypothetical protein
MQQRKQPPQQPGGNFNSITNQHWDVIGDYVPGTHSQKPGQKSVIVDNSNLHLELSSDSSGNKNETSDVDENNTDLEDSEGRSVHKKKSIRKAFMMNDDDDDDEETSDNETVDENKENNSMYPNLGDLTSGGGGRGTAKKGKSVGNKKPAQNLYPNLDSYGGKFEQQQQQQLHYGKN